MWGGQNRAGKEINRVGHTCVMPRISPNEQIEIFGGPSFLARSSHASRYQGFSVNLQPGFTVGRFPNKHSFASNTSGAPNLNSGAVTDIALEVSGPTSFFYLNESDALFIETAMDTLFSSNGQQSRVAPLVQSLYRPVFFNPNSGSNDHNLTVARGKVPDATVTGDPQYGFFKVDQQVGPLNPNKTYAYYRTTQYTFKVIDMSIAATRPFINFDDDLSSTYTNFDIQFLHPEILVKNTDNETFLSQSPDIKIGDEFLVGATFSGSFNPVSATSSASGTKIKVVQVSRMASGYQIKFLNTATDAMFQLGTDTQLVLFPANLDGVHVCNPFEVQNAELVDASTLAPNSSPSPIAASGAIPSSLLFTAGDIEELGLAPGQEYFARELFTIGRGFFSFRKFNFEGANCSGSLVSEYSERGTFEATLGDNDFYDTNIVVKDRSMTLRQPLTAARVNASPQNACSIANWTLGVPRSFMNEGSCVAYYQGRAAKSFNLKVVGSKLIIEHHKDEEDNEHGNDDKGPFTLERVKE